MDVAALGQDGDNTIDQRIAPLQRQPHDIILGRRSRNRDRECHLLRHLSPLCRGHQLVDGAVDLERDVTVRGRRTRRKGAIAGLHI